jgi:hypothetical protein
MSNKLRFGVSIGHNPDAASFTNKNEYSEGAVIAGWIVKLAMENNLTPYIIGTGKLKKKVKEINKLKLDCAIELHLNSGGGIGGETLYCPGSAKGKKFAEIIHKKTSKIMTRDRGIKKGYFKMDPKNPPNFFLKKTNCPALILEHYFLDNIFDKPYFFNNLFFYVAYAESVVKGLVKYAAALRSSCILGR